MFEKFTINKEQVEKIEKQVKLNTFLDSHLESGTVGRFEAKHLLSATDFELEKNLSKERERFLEKFTIDQILEALLRESTFVINENGYVEILHNLAESELPPEYGFKGGSARSMLREVLGLRTIPPRDVDVIRLGDEPYDRADIDIAEKYMAQDFEFGDGVEFVDSATEYLESRDFTINEVYTHGAKIIATEQCIKDTIRNIVRITEYEREAYSSGENIGPKMKAKTLRLHAEQMYAIGVSSIPEDDMNNIEKSFINPFWLSVQLDRAFERGLEVAERFTEILVKTEIVPKNIRDSTDLGEYLMSEVYDFKFRNAPHLQYKIEEDHTEDGSEETDVDVLERYFDTVHYGSKY